MNSQDWCFWLVVMLFHCYLGALFHFERYLFSQGYWQQGAGRFQSLLHSIFDAGFAEALEAAIEDTGVSKVTDCELGDRGLFRKEQLFVPSVCFQPISEGLPDVGVCVGWSLVELWSCYFTVAVKVRSPTATVPVWPIVLLPGTGTFCPLTRCA